jgi:ABC-type phosphate transport system substrate-binding protein
LFHSVPNVPDLNLDSCIIAKIFDRTITDWTDQEIVDLNPNIKELIGANTFPITVARRKLGSSSTASFTQVRSRVVFICLPILLFYFVFIVQ